MGDGDAPRLAPLDSCLRRNDACGRLPSSALRTGFDRLRANGFGRRAFGGEWGCVGDGDAPRGAPALGSRESGNDDGGCGGTRWREGLVSGGSPLSRAGGSRTAPTTGVGRTRAGVMRGLLVVVGPFESLGVIGIAKRTYGLGWRSGTHDSRLWWGRFAPLDSCLRRNVAAGGVWGASSRRSPGRTGRHATRPRHGPRRPGRRGDGRVPPFAAGPPWRPP